VNTLIVALWPQVNPAVAWALTNLRGLGLRASLRCQDYSALGRRALVAVRNTPSLLVHGFFAGLTDHWPE
jgi:hypothetical protein